MAAPKGNQYAVGNPNSGRPPKYDEAYLEIEAADLLSFADKEDSTSIYQFVNPKEYNVDQLTDFCKRSEVFCHALKKAKARIGYNREKKVHENKFNYGIQQRAAGIYDSLLHDYEDSLKVREAELKRSIQPELSPESLVQIAAVMDQIQTTRQKA